MTITLCLSRSLVLLNRRSRAHSLGSKGPFGLMWLSLPHFVYISIRSSTQLPLARRTQLNYIIIRRPLDLWNRMFNCHQAEITVMQFRGHSLPVHHSVVYHGNYLVPFHQPISTHAISSPNCHWNVSLLPVHHLGIAFFLSRVEGQNITLTIHMGVSLNFQYIVFMRNRTYPLLFTDRVYNNTLICGWLYFDMSIFFGAFSQLL